MIRGRRAGTPAMAAVAVTRLAMVAAVLLIAFGATEEVSFREQLIAMARISDGHVSVIQAPGGI